MLTSVVGVYLLHTKFHRLIFAVWFMQPLDAVIHCIFRLQCFWSWIFKIIRAHFCAVKPGV